MTCSLIFCCLEIQFQPYLLFERPSLKCAAKKLRNTDRALVYGSFNVTFNHNDNYSILEKLFILIRQYKYDFIIIFITYVRIKGYDN